MTINELPATTPAPHTGHTYTAVSAHNTSEGRVVYQRCVCGLWRILRYSRAVGTVLEAAVDQRKESAAPARLAAPVYAST